MRRASGKEIFWVRSIASEHDGALGVNESTHIMQVCAKANYNIMARDASRIYAERFGSSAIEAVLFNDDDSPSLSLEGMK